MAGLSNLTYLWNSYRTAMEAKMALLTRADRKSVKAPGECPLRTKEMSYQLFKFPGPLISLNSYPRCSYCKSSNKCLVMR